MSEQLSLDELVAVTIARGTDGEQTYIAGIGAHCGSTEKDGAGCYWFEADDGRRIWHCGRHGFESRS